MLIATIKQNYKKRINDNIKLQTIIVEKLMVR